MNIFIASDVKPVGWLVVDVGDKCLAMRLGKFVTCHHHTITRLSQFSFIWTRRSPYATISLSIERACCYFISKQDNKATHSKRT